MKLNRKNTKKRMPNNIQKIRHKKQFLRHQPKKGRNQKASAIGRIGKSSAKKRQVIILRKRRLSWKRIKLFFLLLFFALILLSLYFRR